MSDRPSYTMNDGLPSVLHCGVTKLRHKATGEVWTLTELGCHVQRLRTSGIVMLSPRGERLHYFGPTSRSDRVELARDFEDPRIAASADCYVI